MARSRPVRPAIVRGQLAGQDIELRIGDGSTVADVDTGTVHHFATADDGTITDHGEDESDDPDYRIRTSEDAFFAVPNASDPAAEFDRQYADGNVRIDGVGIGNTATVEAVKAAVWVGRTLGLL